MWTGKQTKYLESNYSDTPTKDIAEYLGKSIRAVYDRAYLLGLKKSKVYKVRYKVANLRKAA